MTGTVRLFVYGSLMSTEYAHSKMHGARFLCEARTPARFDLAHLNRYPAMVPGSRAVFGEVYEVGAGKLRELDAYEEHPSVYRRTTIRLENGWEVQAYLQRPEQVIGRPRLPSADWRRRDELIGPGRRSVPPPTGFTSRGAGSGS